MGNINALLDALDERTIAKEIGIPLSWKLTAQQKQNIDEAWLRVVSAEPRHVALGLMDEYFSPQP